MGSFYYGKEKQYFKGDMMRGREEVLYSPMQLFCVSSCCLVSPAYETREEEVMHDD